MPSALPYVAGALLLLLPALALAARRLGARRPGWALLGATLAASAPLAITAVTGRSVVPNGELALAIPGATPPRAPVDPYDAGQNDVLLQLLPWEIEVRRAVAERRLPFWSDRLGGGSDLWANPQAMVASPLAWLARPAPVADFLLVGSALRIATAFAGMALAARRFGLGRLAACVPALGYAWGGATTGFALFPLAGSAAFVPWLALAGAHLARDRRGTGRWTTASLAAAACLGGHPVTGAGGLLAAGVSAAAARRAGSPLRSALRSVALPLAVGAALSAPWNLPFAAAAADGEGAHAPVAESRLERPLLDPSAKGILLALVDPFAAPSPDGGRAWMPAVSAYSGVWLLPAALAALAWRPRRRAALLLAFAAALLAAALGPGPLVEWQSRLPILRAAHLPRMASAALCALALAGSLGLAATARRLGAGLHPRARRRAVALATSALLLLALVDLGRFLVRALPRGVAGYPYPSTAWTEWLTARVARTSPARIAATGYRLHPSLLTAYGLEEVRPHNHALEPRRLAIALEAGLGLARPSHAYFSALTRPDHPLLDYLGVRWVIAGAEETPPPDMVREAGPIDGAPVLWENLAALPRFFAPRRLKRLSDPSAAAWLRKLEDPRLVGLDRAAGPLPKLGEEPTTVEGGDGQWSLAVAGSAPTFWASAIPWAAGWRARGRGGRVALHRVNGAFLGLEIGAGAERRVELSYRPRGLLSGGALALAGMLALALSHGRRPREDAEATWRRGP